MMNNRIHTKIILSSAAVLSVNTLMNAQDSTKPNILWLSFEDISSYAFGCYGNEFVTTPNIDSLAANGLRYVNAYSCGPQSSPSRSTLITGCFATTYGMEQHRSRVGTPDDIFFPDYLRRAGYYCTNNQKTDYNSSCDDKSIWDECSANATYNSPSRASNQPFFAVFNSQITHMSRITSVHLNGRRDFAKEGLDPAKLKLPPHVPDLPEIRSDYAFHLEGANDIDRWIGLFLSDLKQKGLDDNTIIFIFSDHGGCLPRGKGFAYETSFRVPFVVYLPPKWRHLAKNHIGEPVERLVCFADFAPSVLSAAGVEIPDYMQGIPFLGNADKAERKYQFGFVGNQGAHFMPVRTVSDGKMKYIRRFIPYKNDALLNDFQWQMPSNLYWDKIYFENKAKTFAEKRPFELYEAELLYDIENDPFEMDNLIGRPEYASDLNRLKSALQEHMQSSGDLGLIPRSLRFYGDKGNIFYNTAANKYDLAKVSQLAWMTSEVAETDIIQLITNLKEKDDAVQFWAVVNLSQLAVKGGLSTAPPELINLLKHSKKDIASEAAFAVIHTKEWKTASAYIENNVEKCLNILEQLSFDKSVWKNRISNKTKDSLILLASLENGISLNTVPARKILVNIGDIPAELLYGHEKDEEGLKTNKKRRPLLPSPTK
ncbi:MAG: sulfatase [Candidatus Cryptobacteroides sp.]